MMDSIHETSQAVKTDDPTKFQHIPDVRSLLVRNDLPHLYRDTPFMYAIKNNKHKVLAYLLQERIASAVDPIPMWHNKISPLVLAMYLNHLDVVRVLVENGAPITDSELLTALNTRKTDIFLYLIQQPGVNLNITAATGKSLLYSAIEYNMPEQIILTLIKHGAHLTEATNMNTPLHANAEHAIASISTDDSDEPFTDMIFTNKRFMDLDWIRRQIGYVERLSAYDKVVLRGYTYNGDVIANSYLRGSFKLPQFMESRRTMSVVEPFHKYVLMKRGNLPDAVTNRTEFYNDLEANHKTYIESFIADLQRIIMAAPRTEKPIKVYRGIKDPQYMYAELNKSKEFTTSDFQSTSVSAAQAIAFANNGLGAVLEVLLEAGTPCLYMEPATSFEKEVEILLPMGIQLTHRQTVKKIYPPYSSAGNFMVSVIEMEPATPA